MAHASALSRGASASPRRMVDLEDEEEGVAFGPLRDRPINYHLKPNRCDAHQQALVDIDRRNSCDLDMQFQELFTYLSIDNGNPESELTCQPPAKKAKFACQPDDGDDDMPELIPFKSIDELPEHRRLLRQEYLLLLQKGLLLRRLAYEKRLLQQSVRRRRFGPKPILPLRPTFAPRGPGGILKSLCVPLS